MMVNTPSQRTTTTQHAGALSAPRRRIAILSTWHPEPADNGRKQRTRAMIGALAERYDIALICLLPSETLDAGPLPAVPRVWRQWALPLPVFHPYAPAALAAGLRPLPRSIVATWSSATAGKVSDLIGDAGAELVIGTDLRTLRYLLALAPSTRLILDEPDVSPFVAGAGGTRCGLARLRAVSRERKYRRLLRGAARRLDAVVVASDQEAQAYQRLAGPSRVTVLENGVAGVSAEPWRAPGGAWLLYTGSVSYGPNAEAIAHFARDILPLVASEVPEARLLVTGELPAALPPAVQRPGVALTGWLSDDGLEALYRRSRACVVPVLSGTGTRIKILEALARGVPVVSTSKGAEGLAVVGGEHLLIADDPRAFANAALRLLRNADFAERLGARGREFVRQRHDWAVRGEELRDLVRRTLCGPA